MKKGITYVDLAISVGIFLVAITIAFSLIRPLIKQENIGLSLLPVLRQGFENSTYWKIYRYPFYLNSSQPIAKDYEVEVPFNFSSTNLNLTDSKLNYVDFEYKKVTIPVLQYQDNFNISFVFSFDPSKATVKEPFYILYSSDFSYTPSTFSNPINPVFISSANYTFGIREEITGVSMVKFLTLKDYNDLKLDFKIPANNDFSIALYDPRDNKLMAKYPQAQESAFDNVFAIQYNSFILYDNSSRQPILVSLQVW